MTNNENYSGILPHNAESYWTSSIDLPKHPSLENDMQVDIIIVGGGITGITSAYLLVNEGLKVAVIVSIPYVKLSSFTPFVPNGWSSVGASSVIIFFSFVGWEMITPLAEEFKRPAKDISISLFLGAIFISIMYIAISFVTIGTHSYGDKDQIASLSILISKGLGPIGTYITTILAIFISFSAVHANIAVFSRMIYAQAREGHFPSFFAKLHSQFQTPTRVLLVLGGIFSCILIFYGMARPNLEMLLKGPSVIFITSYIFTMLAALKLLKVRDIGWWMAFLSLIICIIVYSFSG